MTRLFAYRCSALVALAACALPFARVSAETRPAAPVRATPAPQSVATPSSGARPQPPKPEAPCEKFSAPLTIENRWAELGGAKTLGCYESFQNDSYRFHSGQIKMIPTYGSDATYAAILEKDTFVHLFLKGSYHADVWQVRLSYEGTLVNQVRYNPGQGGDVAADYASDIIVHPGGRHGKLDIAMQGCRSNLDINSICFEWKNADITMEL